LGKTPNQNLADALLNRYFTYRDIEVQQDNKNLQLQDIEEISQLEPQYPSYYYPIGKFYEEQKEIKKANQYYNIMFDKFRDFSNIEQRHTEEENPFGYMNNKYNGKQRPISIFKFSPLNEYTLKTLMREELFLARPHKDWNDPHDCNIRPWTDLAHNIFKEKARLQCFFAGEEPFTKILMWSHYADKHKGICVEYEYVLNHENTIASLHEVKYQPDMKVRESWDAFIIKAKDWEYENEVRLFHFDKNNTEETSVLKPFDKLGLKVKAVYFGERLKSDDSIIKTVQNIFKYREEVKEFLDKYKTLDIWSINAIKTLLFDIEQKNPNKTTKKDVAFYKMTTQALSFVLHAEPIEEEAEPAITTPA
jgi:hypothetical protein